MSSRTPADESDRAQASAEDRERGSWTVWRQDDNGNRVEVARHDNRADADTLAATMEARGHRQIYWVAATAD